MNKKTIIIGAGPAGLACGYSLAKKGGAVEVFEAGPYVGGMARSFDLWGQRVDLGPHRFFSKQRDINAFFTELMKEDFTMVNRQTRIYYNERFFDYPLKLGNVLSNLPPWTILQIMTHYMVQVIRPIKNPKTFDAWVTNRFGRKLFEIFFECYTEKLWGIKCSQIDADWAAQRIKTLTLTGAVMSAIRGNKGNKHKTLVDEFAYPKHGTGTLYERATEYIAEHGGTVACKTPVKRVILNQAGNKVTGIELADGSIRETDTVVSTMPLTTLVNGLENVPEKVREAVKKLYFRNTILVYLEIDRTDLFTDNWLYIHAPEVLHGRITNFRNWCSTLTRGKDTTILCLEYWCFDRDELWTGPDQAVIDIAKKEIYQINLIPKEANILNATAVRVPKCYPVYETGYQQWINVIIDYLKGIEGLIPIGRYGAFKYNNQDHSILMGLLAADKIVDGAEVDLWAINTDTEYQEEGKIKDVLTQ